MIRVSITHWKHGCTMHLRGHAEYNPGNDIVCAAVSGLMQTLGTYLASEGIGKGDFRKGDITVTSDNPDSLPYFRMTEHGLRSLARSFPQHVTVLDTAGGVLT